jgi:hypothetical protein
MLQLENQPNTKTQIQMETAILKTSQIIAMLRLQAAMNAKGRLGMTRDQLCKRISVPRKTLDKWMAPEGTKEHRGMPEMAWSYVRDVLRWENSS